MYVSASRKKESIYIYLLYVSVAVYIENSVCMCDYINICALSVAGVVRSHERNLIFFLMHNARYTVSLCVCIYKIATAAAAACQRYKERETTEF